MDSISSEVTKENKKDNPVDKKKYYWIPYLIIMVALTILIFIGIYIYYSQVNMGISITILVLYSIAIVALFVGFIWIYNIS